MIEQKLKKDDYKSPADVIHLALEYFAQSEDWLPNNSEEISQAIEEGLDRAERCGF